MGTIVKHVNTVDVIIGGPKDLLEQKEIRESNHIRIKGSNLVVRNVLGNINMEGGVSVKIVTPHLGVGCPWYGKLDYK